MKELKKNGAAYLSALALLSGCGLSPKTGTEAPKIEVVTEDNDTTLIVENLEDGNDKNELDTAIAEGKPVIITKKVAKEVPVGTDPVEAVKNAISFDKYGNQLKTAVVNVTTKDNVHKITLETKDYRGNVSQKTVEVVEKEDVKAPVVEEKDELTIANENLKKAMERLAESRFALELAKNTYEKAVADKDISAQDLSYAKTLFLQKNKTLINASNELQEMKAEVKALVNSIYKTAEYVTLNQMLNEDEELLKHVANLVDTKEVDIASAITERDAAKERLLDLKDEIKKTSRTQLEIREQAGYVSDEVRAKEKELVELYKVKGVLEAQIEEKNTLIQSMLDAVNSDPEIQGLLAAKTQAEILFANATEEEKQAKDEFVRLTAERNQANAAIESIQSDLVELNTAKEKMEAAKTLLDEKTAELETLKTQQASVISEMEEATSSVEEKQSKVSDAQAILDTKTQEQATLTTTYEEAKAEFDTVKANLEQNASKLTEKKATLSETEQQLVAAVEEKLNAETQEQAARNTLDQATATHTQATESLEAAKAVAESAKVELAKQEEVIATLTAEKTEKGNLSAIKGRQLENAKQSLQDAQNRLEQAQRELEENQEAVRKVEEAKQVLAAAKERTKQANAVVARGSFGFFKEVATAHEMESIEKLYEVMVNDPELKSKDTVKRGEFARPELGHEHDATNLDNMKLAFDYIHESHRVRQNENETEGTNLQHFKIISREMALAQLTCDAELMSVRHYRTGDADRAGFLTEGEISAWGPYTPEKAYIGYYWAEKLAYKIQIEKDPVKKAELEKEYDENYSYLVKKTGHYKALVMDDWQYTGLGVIPYYYRKNEEGKTEYVRQMTLQSFALTKYSGFNRYERNGNAPECNDVNVYTVEEYETLFNNYYDRVMGELSAATEAEKAAQDALTKLGVPANIVNLSTTVDRITKEVETLTRDVQDKESAFNESTASVDDVTARLESETNKKTELEANKATADQDVNEKQAIVDEKAQALETAKTDLQEKEAALRTLEEKKNELESQKAALSEVIATTEEEKTQLEADKARLESEIEEATNSLESIKAEVETAQNNVNVATDALNEAQAELDSKTTKNAEVIKEVETATNALEDAKSGYESVKVEDVDARIAEKNEELTSKTDEKNQLDTQVDNAEQASATKLEEKNKAEQDLTNAQTAYTEAVDAKSQEVETEKGLLNGLESSKTETDASIATAEEVVKEKTAILEDAEAKIAELEEANVTNTAESEKLEQSIKTQEASIETMSQELEDAKSNKAEIEGRVSENTVKKESYEQAAEAKINEASAAVQKQEEAVSTLEAEHAEVAETVKVAEETVATQTVEVQAQEVAVSQAEANVVAAEQAVEVAQQAVNELTPVEAPVETPAETKEEATYVPEANTLIID